MRIGLSTFVMDGGRSGIATYVRELARGLQIEDYTNEYELFMTRRDADLITVSVPNFSKTIYPSLIGNPLFNLAWHNTLLPLERGYDVIHVPSARRVPLIKNTRVVATVHDLAAFSIEAKYDPARMLFNRKLVPAMIRRADHVIAVSEFTKKDLINHVGIPEERITVIYSGINHALFEAMDPEAAREKLQLAHGLDKPFFTYVSRLEHPGKNHIRLIEAFERFKLENDSAHQLVLAGADWHGANVIKARAAESPVRDDIVFLGFVPAKSLPLLYSGCDLMIFPSLFEGFGFPIIEALSCGAPVICSNTSSMREIAEGVVPTFDPTDSNELFERMHAVVATGRNDETRTRGTEYAKKYEWRETAQRVMEVYRSLG